MIAVPVKKYQQLVNAPQGGLLDEKKQLEEALMKSQEEKQKLEKIYANKLKTNAELQKKLSRERSILYKMKTNKDLF